MSEFVPIGKIFSEKYAGKEVGLRGWVYRKRSSGGVQFIVLRDSTGVIQIAVKKENVSEKEYEDVDKALIESSIAVRGVVKEDKRAPGGYEVEAKKVSVTSFSEPFPITEHQSTELLLDLRHLWIRSQRLTNIMKARHYMVNYLREFFVSKGFWEVAPPIITQSACEGGATVFPIQYFEQKAYLTQSAQLYLEGLIYSLEKVFCFIPAFRADRSRTVRHLSEYWTLEPEMAYYNSEQNIQLQEEMISYVCKKMANHRELLEYFGRNPKELAGVEPPFKRLSYDEALEELAKKGVRKEWGDDMGVEDEKVLTAEAKKPIVVYNYPKKAKAFYMRINPDNPETVLNNDMLAPEGHGEIIGGSERIWEYGELMERMKEQGLNLKEYGWYIDLRKYGSVPHSGFGLGVERLLKWLLNLEHIRDAIPFPRTINRVYP